MTHHYMSTKNNLLGGGYFYVYFSFLLSFSHNYRNRILISHFNIYCLPVT